MDNFMIQMSHNPQNLLRRSMREKDRRSSLELISHEKEEGPQPN